MLFQSTCFLILCLAPFQEEADTKTLYQQAPADWRSEVIPFPLGFAPDIPLKGVEELRFAPGMFKVEAEDYFTYSFLWWLDGKTSLTAEQIQAYLLDYFAGLYKAVSKTESKDTSAFSVTVRTSKADAWIADASQFFQGTASWVDPFVTEKPLKLTIHIAQWYCQDHTAYFFLLSPQTEDHAIWDVLRAQVAGRCDQD